MQEKLDFFTWFKEFRQAGYTSTKYVGVLTMKLDENSNLEVSWKSSM